MRRALHVGLALGVACAACFRGPLPARELYRLTVPDPPAPESARAGPLRGTLAILRYQTPGIYGDEYLVYRIGESQYGAYPSREWAVPLGDQLGVLSEAVLRRAPVSSGAALYDPPSPRASTYLWRGTVREFEEVDRGHDVFAAVRLDAALVRSADDSVLWTGSVRLERPVSTPTTTAIVETLSALAAEAVDRLATEANAAVRGRLTSGQ